jgi:hypothetical protein
MTHLSSCSAYRAEGSGEWSGSPNPVNPDNEWICDECGEVIAASTDLRDPDYSHKGIFQYHNCYRCHDGQKPCIKGKGNERQCDTLQARND